MTDIDSQIEQTYKELSDLQTKLKTLHQELPLEPVENFEFEGRNGTTSLDQLFGDKDELIVIHNMGKDCPYCTLWADGFNGFQGHLQDRAAFTLVSPNSFSELDAFAKSRKWAFNYVSSNGNDYQKAMGFWNSDAPENTNPASPGVSTFLKQDSKIYRKTHTRFSPGDLYCGIWHLFDLLPKGQNGWNPKYSYTE